ncbi:hypothetical protein POKO110462_13780 [Pontibacter korlensis]|uniref:hypothetical protein n=1 Tax=Pontibacter korlensis TaxID=400092 RepID=UPI000696064D|nr:hypothetical protein [Pontibacter korlensis]
MNLILRTMPSDDVAPALEKTALNDELSRGKYLVTVGACGECHSPSTPSGPIAGKEFAGGMEFTFPNGAVLRSANITPDKDTGTGKWTEDAFVQRFKMYQDPALTLPRLKAVGFLGYRTIVLVYLPSVRAFSGIFS